jgi:hypothetical protein
MSWFRGTPEITSYPVECFVCSRRVRPQETIIVRWRGDRQERACLGCGSVEPKREPKTKAVKR